MGRRNMENNRPEFLPQSDQVQEALLKLHLPEYLHQVGFAGGKFILEEQKIEDNFKIMNDLGLRKAIESQPEKCSLTYWNTIFEDSCTQGIFNIMSDLNNNTTSKITSNTIRIETITLDVLCPFIMSSKKINHVTKH